MDVNHAMAKMNVTAASTDIKEQMIKSVSNAQLIMINVLENKLL